MLGPGGGLLLGLPLGLDLLSYLLRRPLLGLRDLLLLLFGRLPLLRFPK
jgi:hypothetical protein